MENQSEQLSLFSEKAFEPRDIGQAELMKTKANVEKSQVIVSYIANDCFYYMGAGNCAMHGDAVGCVDCDECKSTDDDDDHDND